MATYWENSCSFGLRYVSWYKYLIVSLVFSHLGFWSGNLFLIAPFPDLCLLVPFYDYHKGRFEIVVLLPNSNIHYKLHNRHILYYDKTGCNSQILKLKIWLKHAYIMVHVCLFDSDLLVCIFL